MTVVIPELVILRHQLLILTNDYFITYLGYIHFNLEVKSTGSNPVVMLARKSVNANVS